MGREPVAIVREYLHSSEPQARKNACVALRALATPESMAALADAALRDPDVQVRHWAEEQIARTEEPALAGVFAHLERALDDGETREAAAMVLAGLARRGVELRLARAGFLARLRRAAGVGTLRTARLWKVSLWRVVRDAAVGATVGTAAMWGFLWFLFQQIDWQTALGAVILVPPLSALCAFLMARRASPIHLHFDRAAGVLVNLLNVLRTALIISVVMCVFLSFTLLGDEPTFSGPRDFALVAALVLTVVPLLAAAIRLGTMGAARAFENPRRTWAAEIVAGSAVGMLVATLAAVVGERWSGKEFGENWMILTAGSVGLAAGFARIDRESAPRSIPPTRASSMAATLPVAVVALLLAWVALSRAERSVRGAEAQSAESAAVNALLSVERYPEPRVFRVDARGTMSATVPNEDREHGKDYAIGIWDVAKNDRVMLKDNPPAIKVTLNAGSYCLLAYPVDVGSRPSECPPSAPVDANTALDALLARLQGRRTRGTKIQPFAVILGFNAEVESEAPEQRGWPLAEKEPRQPPTTAPRPPSPQDGMAVVPGGPFWMGCNGAIDQECDAGEKPGRIERTGEYRIDRHEVTVAEYRRCQEAGACSAEGLDKEYAAEEAKATTTPYCNWGRPGGDQYPINCVSWQQARSFCEWARKSLPTEMQWEKAARGQDGRKYPWGNAAPEAAPVANVADETAKKTFPDWEIFNGYDDGGIESTAVGQYPAGASPCGALDMVGNVAEWTLDAPADSPSRRWVRGGSWLFQPKEDRASAHQAFEEEDRRVSVGFRCVATESE